jgi:phage terminase large subunit-like protein
MPIQIAQGPSETERIIAQYGKNVLEKFLKKGDNWRLTKDWDFIGRKEQIPPDDDLWQNWLYLGGRGTGKTKSICEWAKKQIVNHNKKRIAAIARTAGDIRRTLVYGVSGIMDTMSELGPSHNKQDGEIRFQHSDAIIFLYSAETPDSLRGPAHDAAICDEFAAWKYLEDTWDNLQFGLRIGNNPQTAIATTPRPLKSLKDILSENTTAFSKGTTYDNIANLSPAFFKRIINRYEGTRLGNQELLAELLDVNPDALFNLDNIHANRVKKAPDLKKIVISVDPSGNEGIQEKMRRKEEEDGVGDDCGIVAVGEDYDNHYYVLADVTCNAKPEKWAKKACGLCCDLETDQIIYESNFGGTMVKRVLKIENPNIRISPVRATRGKAIRAEPISILYEKNRVSHVGIFPKLEDEMTQWDTSQKYSPNRLDALVWGLTWLSKGSSSGTVTVI